MTHFVLHNESGGATKAECIKCPSSLQVRCVGGVLRWSANAWYNPDIPSYAISETIEIHTCFNDECCVRHDDDTKVRCATDKGYSGPLCGACDRASGAMRSGKGCVKCWKTALSAIAVLALVIIILAGIAYLTAQHNFDVPRRVYSATVQKLGISFVQMLGVLGSACEADERRPSRWPRGQPTPCSRATPSQPHHSLQGARDPGLQRCIQPPRGDHRRLHLLNTPR